MRKNNTVINNLIDNYGIDKLMSMVKYPSILTYHDLGDRGTLLPSLVNNKSFSKLERVYITEKVDGSNSFICFSTNPWGIVDDYFIGSRTEPLYFYGDRMVVNKSQGIAEHLIDKANSIVDNTLPGHSGWPANSLLVIYGETYGGNINGYKQYVTSDKYGFRVFDVAIFDSETCNSVLSKTRDAIATWRESDNQPFADVDTIKRITDTLEFNRVPYICVTNGMSIPTDLAGTFAWLKQFESSCAKLDDDAYGKAEGVVVRTADRSLIRKIRFEDYEKTQRKGIF